MDEVEVRGVAAGLLSLFLVVEEDDDVDVGLLSLVIESANNNTDFFWIFGLCPLFPLP